MAQFKKNAFAEANRQQQPYKLFLKEIVQVNNVRNLTEDDYPNVICKVKKK